MNIGNGGGSVSLVEKEILEVMSYPHHELTGMLSIRSVQKRKESGLDGVGYFINLMRLGMVFKLLLYILYCPCKCM